MYMYTVLIIYVENLKKDPWASSNPNLTGLTCMQTQTWEVFQSIIWDQFPSLCNMWVWDWLLAVYWLWSRILLIVLDPCYKCSFFVNAPGDQIFELAWVPQCHDELLDILETNQTHFTATSHYWAHSSTKNFCVQWPLGFCTWWRIRHICPIWCHTLWIGALYQRHSQPAKRFPNLAEMACIYLAIPGM